MRIGDVAAPGALLRTPAATEGAGVERSVGAVQRALRERRPVPAHEVPERQERRRELEARTRRFQEAARALVEGEPDAAAEEPALREIETRHRVEDDALPERVAELAEAYNALQTFANAEHLDVGDAFGLLGSDERVRDVLRTLGELASGLAARPSPAPEPAGPEPAGPTLGEKGFLSALSTRQGRLESRAALLEDVVSALSQGPTSEASDSAEH